MGFRECFAETSSHQYRISPLFADNGGLARALLLNLASKISIEYNFSIPMATGSNPCTCIYAYINTCIILLSVLLSKDGSTFGRL